MDGERYCCLLLSSEAKALAAAKVNCQNKPGLRLVNILMARTGDMVKAAMMFAAPIHGNTSFGCNEPRAAW